MTIARSEIDTDTKQANPADQTADGSTKGTTIVPTDTGIAPDDIDDASLTPAETDDPQGSEAEVNDRRVSVSRVLVLGVLPVLALLLAVGAGFLKWQYSSSRASDISRIESVQVAKDAAVAMLSYRPDSADKDLTAAQDRLTGAFKNSYADLTRDVVIPGAKQKHITAVATVPAVASISATQNHAVVLVFVNQSVTIGDGAPTDTASSVKVALDRIGGRWLVSSFDPI